MQTVRTCDDVVLLRWCRQQRHHLPLSACVGDWAALSQRLHIDGRWVGAAGTAQGLASGLMCVAGRAGAGLTSWQLEKTVSTSSRRPG